MKKINKPLLIALIIGAAYLVYSLVYWSGANAGSGTSSEKLGAAVATAMAVTMADPAPRVVMERPSFRCRRCM